MGKLNLEKFGTVFYVIQHMYSLCQFSKTIIGVVPATKEAEAELLEPRPA
jgi:hypothetical protein